jgi:pimeloyl-ACP methyl ester carboxylesterase
MRSHWAFRKLAALLSREGFHVFRFDYHGTGDSAGDGHEVTLRQCRDDAQLALGELKDLAGVRKLSAVAFRLGAAVALGAPLKLRMLVLWEPVVNGIGHVDELCDQHRRRYAYHIHPPALSKRGALREVLGVPFPVALQAEVESLDLLKDPVACRAERIVVVSSEEDPAHQRLAERLRRESSAPSELRRVAEEGAASDDAFLLGARAQREIGALLQERP